MTAAPAESVESARSPAPPTTAAELFVRNAERDDAAAHFEDRSCSWRELALESRRRAALWSRRRDPAAPPHLGVLLDNTVEYLYWLGAAAITRSVIVGINATRKVVVTGVEMFKKLLDQGQAGDNVGCLLRGIERDDIERGQVLAKPGSVTPHTKFVARVYVLTKEEGGRHTPFYNGYRPQFYLRTTDVTGAIGLPDGAEMIMPGDNVDMTVDLITPIALEVGQRFAIREGGRTVGAGAITSIVE